ncbi:MAG: pilus assembly protein TadG-related protein [Acidobacteriaceae bacterium]
MINLKPENLKAPTGEEGQAAISVVLILALFLLAVLGFAVDLTNLWFHRQAAQAAADAACQAGAMDLLQGSTASSIASSGFTPGVASNCATTPGSTMCAYATANGYNGTGLVSGAASNSVSWTFPTTVPGVTATGSYPFLQVSIAENILTYFMGWANGSRYATLNASCTCGVVQVKGTTPMVVLHPTMSGALYNAGAGVVIVGGPARGLQVNSNSSTAVTGSSIIDLSKGGANGTGSDAAVSGGPTTPGSCTSSSGFCGGSTGVWRSNVLPVPDPFGSVNVPTAPPTAPAQTFPAYGVDGCPDHRGCTEFYPGNYPNGIKLSGSTTTAIFDPGIYYMGDSLTSTSTATVRNAKPSGHLQTDGAMFYFLNGSLDFAGSTGTDTTDIDPVQSTDLTCDGSPPPAVLNIPSTLPGNLLIAQCTQQGTYWDTTGDTTDSVGTPGVRGLLAFQDHNNTTQPTLTGSGSLSFGGALYFHAVGYVDSLKFAGNGSSATFIIGEIVADQITFSGNGAVSLALNPVATIDTSKVAILQ